MSGNFRRPIEFVRAGEGVPETVMIKKEVSPTPAPKEPKKTAQRARSEAVEGPWTTANPRIKMQFNMRLPEPLHAKLKWLGENTPDSMHSIAMEAIEEVVNKRLRLMSDAGTGYK